MQKSKKCTGCHATLSLENFHSKGSRLDSRCKKCVNQKKRTIYSQVTGGDKGLRNLKAVASFLIQHEIKELDKFNEKLRKIIQSKS